MILGGPIGVYEVDAYPFLKSAIALIERRLSWELPTLENYCLGSQLMARRWAAGSLQVEVKEIGWGRIELTTGCGFVLKSSSGAGAVVLHWHGDSFDLPRGAQRLASNAQYENQAFGYGRNALALEFHLEADPRQLEVWYVGHAAELAAAKVSVAELRAATARLASGLAYQADRIFTRWLREIAQPAFQPKVKAKAWTPGSRNSISKVWSAIAPGWRIS